MGTPDDPAAGELARRLRELRDGSGRSYGSLARRIGVSASTLHRYCSGATVPAEFAPVERLARFSGCTGAELVALHRAWVLADEERTRRREAASATPRAAASPVAPAPPEEPETSAEVPAPAAGFPAEAPAPVITVVQGDPPPAETRLWGVVRRTRVAVVVMVLAVGLVVGLVGYGNRPDERSVAGAERGEGGRGGPGPVPAPSAGPSKSPAAGSPSGAVGSAGGGGTKSAPGTSPGTGPGTGTSGGGTDDGPAASGGRTPVEGAPFTWTADQHVWAYGCDHAYLVGREPSDVPPPPVEADAPQWARAAGAVHGGETRVRITLQGTDERAVVLHGLQVRTAARREPPGAGRVYRMGGGCGGVLTPRTFAVDLDRRRPLARSVPGHGENGPIPAVSLPYRVSASDPEILLVTASARECDCDWYLELEWSSGGRRGVVRIDEGGRPFRTSGVAGRPVHEYDTAARRWIPAGGQDGTPDPAAVGPSAAAGRPEGPDPDTDPARRPGS
ncbi:helix-turn-helix transcriptional regulator [Streptomyces sp. NPDC006798]|uniref:helix-turn-helix domain-containing protein n=1 Tax=Streptomyces sp. NPDC006798 TaxID=3155462 RepID=UPI0034046F69